MPTDLSYIIGPIAMLDLLMPENAKCDGQEAGLGVDGERRTFGEFVTNSWVNAAGDKASAQGCGRLPGGLARQGPVMPDDNADWATFAEKNGLTLIYQPEWDALIETPEWKQSR